MGVVIETFAKKVYRVLPPLKLRQQPLCIINNIEIYICIYLLIIKLPDDLCSN